MEIPAKNLTYFNVPVSTLSSRSVKISSDYVRESNERHRFLFLCLSGKNYMSYTKALAKEEDTQKPALLS